MSTIKARVRYPFEHNPYSFLSINSTSVLSGMWLKAKLKSKRICWALVLMPFLARFENKNDRNLGIFLPLQNKELNKSWYSIPAGYSVATRNKAFEINASIHHGR